MQMLEQLETEPEMDANHDLGRESDITNHVFDTMTWNFAFFMHSVLTPTETIMKQRRQYGKQDLTFQEAWNHKNLII